MSAVCFMWGVIVWRVVVMSGSWAGSKVIVSTVLGIRWSSIVACSLVGLGPVGGGTISRAFCAARARVGLGCGIVSSSSTRLSKNAAGTVAAIGVALGGMGSIVM